MPSTETVDIYDLIFERVRNFPHSERIRKKVNFDGLDSSCVEEAKLQIYNRPTTHNITTNQSLASGVAERPKTSIIFSSTFTNSTTMEQTNNMRTEKRTTATCRLQLTKSVTKNGNISIQVTPPNTMIQANGGFSREKTLTTEKEEVLEEELVWSLDSQVVVPPGFRTKADFVITEGNYVGTFKVDTVFDGKITVNLRDKRKHTVATFNIDNLREVLKPEHGFKPLEGSTTGVVFTNEGVCSCSYGIEQKVELNEEKL